MKKTFRVTFKYSDSVYCGNICIAESIEDVKRAYSKYEWSSVEEATEYDLEEAQKKGKPIITLEAPEIEEEADPEELRTRALEILEDDETFMEAVDYLDRENGFADGYACYPMWELNDYCAGMSACDLLEKLTKDFNCNDDFFYWSIYGLESTDDKCALYRDNTCTEEVLDNMISSYGAYCHFEGLNPELVEIVKALA